jgi:hypothetical protein
MPIVRLVFCVLGSKDNTFSQIYARNQKSFCYDEANSSVFDSAGNLEQ